MSGTLEELLNNKSYVDRILNTPVNIAVKKIFSAVGAEV